MYDSENESKSYLIVEIIIGYVVMCQYNYEQYVLQQIVFDISLILCV